MNRSIPRWCINRLIHRDLKELRNMQAINPIARRFYFDKVRVWVRHPLTKCDEARLRKACGPSGLYVENAPAWFNPVYQQRLDLYQPSREALRLLDRLDGALVNYVEVTCDLILPEEGAKWILLDLFK